VVAFTALFIAPRSDSTRLD